MKHTITKTEKSVILSGAKVWSAQCLQEQEHLTATDLVTFVFFLHHELLEIVRPSLILLHFHSSGKI